MSNKLLCPGCNGYSSTILAAFEQGEPCPFCGLSATAIAEIKRIRESRANDELKAQLETAIKERDAAQVKAATLERQLERVRRAIAEDDRHG